MASEIGINTCCLAAIHAFHGYGGNEHFGKLEHVIISCIRCKLMWTFKREENQPNHWDLWLSDDLVGGKDLLPGREVEPPMIRIVAIEEDGERRIEKINCQPHHTFEALHKLVQIQVGKQYDDNWTWVTEFEGRNIDYDRTVKDFRGMPVLISIAMNPKQLNRSVHIHDKGEIRIENVVYDGDPTFRQLRDVVRDQIGQQYGDSWVWVNEDDEIYPEHALVSDAVHHFRDGAHHFPILKRKAEVSD